MDKFRKVLLVLVCCVVAGCDSSGQQAKNVGKYAPILNAKPKYFVTVKTAVASSLQKKIMPIWIVTYKTTNKACEVTTNSLEGVVLPRIIREHIKSKVVDGRYKDLVIPIDKYKPGYCHWKTGYISYKVDHNEDDRDARVAMFFIGKHVKVLRHYAIDIWGCHDAKNCRQVSLKYFTKYYSGSFSARANYIYVLNYWRM
ncbi:MAG: hypothetical protein KAS93_03580 [Gammaproteobacteria bacterium]|nr:hypothetical protein [Gammaproteobacteria bacterium]